MGEKDSLIDQKTMIGFEAPSTQPEVASVDKTVDEKNKRIEIKIGDDPEFDAFIEERRIKHEKMKAETEKERLELLAKAREKADKSGLKPAAPVEIGEKQDWAEERSKLQSDLYSSNNPAEFISKFEQSLSSGSRFNLIIKRDTSAFSDVELKRMLVVMKSIVEFISSYQFNGNKLVDLFKKKTRNGKHKTDMLASLTESLKQIQKNQEPTNDPKIKLTSRKVTLSQAFNGLTTDMSIRQKFIELVLEKIE